MSIRAGSVRFWKFGGLAGDFRKMAMEMLFELESLNFGFRDGS